MTAPARPTDREQAIGAGLAWLARWSLRLLLVAAAGVALWWLLGRLWVVVLPVFLALVVGSVLWAPTEWLRRHRWPPALAAATVLVGGIALLVGVVAALTNQVVDQVGEIAVSASDGLERIRDWLTGPPLNLRDEQITAATDSVTGWLRDSSSAIASGAVTGVTAVTSGLVTLVLVLVLTFLFLKDGPRFLPWLERVAGQPAGGHVAEVGRRAWAALGAFFRAQAAVGFFDGLFIGIGLFALGVPLALPLGVLTFFGGFVPIVGAFVAGALSVLVALVTNGPTTALLVVALVLVVQQVEGNVLQPILQGRSLQLHAAVILLSVTAGGTIFGIAGAFFAVPVAAVAAAVLRYLDEVLTARQGAGKVVTAGSPLTAQGGVGAPISESTAAGSTADGSTAAGSTREEGTPGESASGTPGDAGEDGDGHGHGGRGWRDRLPQRLGGRGR